MSTKPTIYLHIGAGKTGSTTIQVWLKSVEEALNEAGYLIFDTKFEPGAQQDILSNQQDYFHNVLKNGTSGIKEFQAQFRKNLTYMQEHGFHSAVMSAENLFNHWTDAHRWFMPFVDECNWKIIAYVRNQPYYIISAWKEWFYWRQDFHNSLNGEIYADWLGSLKSWDNTFGADNIYLGILDKKCLTNQLLHHDFAMAINTPHIIANDNDLVYANPSINNRSALLFSKIRHQYMLRNPRITQDTDIHQISSKELRLQTILNNNAKLNEMFHFKPLVVSRAPVSGTLEHDAQLGFVNQTMLDHIYAMFADSNRILLERYRPDIDIDAAFPRIIQTATWELTDEDLMLHGFHIAFESLNSLDKQLSAKAGQLNRLNNQIKLLESEVAQLQDTRRNIGQVWKSTVAHDQAIAHLQAQIDQLVQSNSQVSHQPEHILQRLMRFLRRIFSRK
ncbi:MAG: hypothetical protein ACK5GU_06520 [Chloroflexota bacterium]|jgi:hypothetical protein